MRSVVINEVVRLFFALPARQHKACLHRDDQSHSNRMTMNMNMTTTSTTNELFHRKRQIVSSSVLFPSTPRAASSCLGDKNEDGDIEQGQGIKMSTAPSADTASSSTNPCYQVAVGDDEYNKRGDDQNDDIKKKMKVKRAFGRYPSFSASTAASTFSSLFTSTLFSNGNNTNADGSATSRRDGNASITASTSTIDTFTSSSTSSTDDQPESSTLLKTGAEWSFRKDDPVVHNGTGEEEPDSQYPPYVSPTEHSPTRIIRSTEENVPPSLTQVSYRQVLPRDRQRIQQLHEEWFPVQYQEDFYDDMCEKRQMFGSNQPLITLLAAVPKRRRRQQQQQDTILQHNQQHAGEPSQEIKAIDNEIDYEGGKEDENSVVDNTVIDPALEGENRDDDDDEIVGCIVGCFVSADLLNQASRRLLVPEYYAESNVIYHNNSNNYHSSRCYSHKHHHCDEQQRPRRRHSQLFYIMTLGVVKEYRHLGLATKLVKKVFNETILPLGDECGCMYLHVITFNDAAIKFYERKLGFWRVQEIEKYYTIDDRQHNCYLYASYFNSNWGHLDLYMIVSRWVSSLWTSVSHLWTKNKH